MEQKSDRLYPSAPLEKKYLERLEKQSNDVNSFNNHINKIKEMITYFKDSHKSKKTYKKHKMLTTIIRSFDTIVFIATTYSSITFSLTGIGLIAIQYQVQQQVDYQLVKK